VTAQYFSPVGAVIVLALTTASCIRSPREDDGDASSADSTSDAPDEAGRSEDVARSEEPRDVRGDAGDTPPGCCPKGPAPTLCGECTDLGGSGPCELRHVCNLSPGLWRSAVDDAGCPTWIPGWVYCGP
jgi:hypothetical protein